MTCDVCGLPDNYRGRGVVTHQYEPDRTARPDHRGARPCIHCPLPKANRVHQLPDVTGEQAEHRRRAGEDER